MPKPLIVVVEAYSAMGLLLDDLLIGAGYEVRLWPESVGAHEFIQQEQPDLIILDLSLKRHGDGLEVLIQLCCHPATNHIPVIIVADNSSAVSTLRALPLARRFEVLEKPFYLDQLVVKVGLVVEPPGATLDRARKRSRPFRTQGESAAEAGRDSCAVDASWTNGMSYAGTHDCTR